MRIRPLVAATSLVALLPALAAVGPAATGTPAPGAKTAPVAKAVKVTLKDLPVSSEVGKKVTVAGTARSTKADQVKVVVQRRYGAGPWATVGSDTTNKKDAYSVKVPLVQGGPTSFRVKVGKVTSKAKRLAVYEWLDLVDQPFLVGGGTVELRRTTKIQGRSFPRSIEIPTGSGGLFAKPNGLCTTFELWTGFVDGQTAGLPGTARQAGGVSGYGGPEQVATSFSTPVGPAVRVALDLTGQRYVVMEAFVQDADDADLVLASPRLRCNASTLPPVSEEELSL